MKLILCGFSILATLAFSGCGGGGGGGGGGGPPGTDVTGTWTGSWLSSNNINGGSIDLMITQNGSAITGSVTFTGSPCFAGGAITGNVSGFNVTATLNAGGIVVSLAGTVSGAGSDQMNGTYDVVSAGACTGDTGTVTLTRVAPATFGDPQTPTSTTVLVIYDEQGNRIGQTRIVHAVEEK